MKGAIIFLFAVAGCFADPIPTSQIECTAIPETIFLRCNADPQIMKPEFLKGCTNDRASCEFASCVYANAGFLIDNKVDKTKIATYFDEFASKMSTAWKDAVTHLKTNCLGEEDLPAQGIVHDCPSKGIADCIQGTFLQTFRANETSKPTEEERIEIANLLDFYHRYFSNSTSSQSNK